MSGGYAHSFISSWAWLYGSPFASAWFSASSAFWAASLIDWSRCPAFSSARYTFGRCTFQCALILCSNIGTTPLGFDLGRRLRCLGRLLGLGRRRLGGRLRAERRAARDAGRHLGRDWLLLGRGRRSGFSALRHGPLLGLGHEVRALRHGLHAGRPERVPEEVQRVSEQAGRVADRPLARVVTLQDV